MVELIEIGKYFPSNRVNALNGANFSLQEGEIHALLGENGAGKSTLMHIMAGFIKPDTGIILLDGREKHFSSPALALSLGIGMVRQHPHHIPGFLVWESCAAGFNKRFSLLQSRRSARKQIDKLNERFCFDLPLDSPVETLTVSQGQKAAILTLLLRNTQYLIFDEPAAVLSPEETENLFSLFSVLRNEGKGIVLISHKLEETVRITDRVTVLRQGETRICCKADMISNNFLYEHIFGTADPVPVQKIAAVKDPDMVQEESGAALVLQDFAVNVPGYPLIRGLNLKLKQGTIMGIAGVQDSGLETLELALTGFLPFSGTLCINGTKLSGTESNTAKRVRTFRSAGGTYLGKRNEGKALPIRDILLIHAHRQFQNYGILDKAEIDKWIQSVMAAAKVLPEAKVPAPAKVPAKNFRRDNAAGISFSGGQLQRLLLTREMAGHCALLVLSDPYQGLDKRYRDRLISLLRKKTEEKTAVVVFSTDVKELLDFCDSIAALRDGVFSGVVELENPDELHYYRAKETIQEAMVGRIDSGLNSEDP